MVMAVAWRKAVDICLMFVSTLLSGSKKKLNTTGFSKQFAGDFPESHQEETEMDS